MWKRFTLILTIAIMSSLSSAPGLSFTSSTSTGTEAIHNLGFFLSDITEGSSLPYGTCQYYNPDSGRRGVGGAPFNCAKLFAYSVNKKAQQKKVLCNRLQLRRITAKICQVKSTLSLARMSFSVKAYYVNPLALSPLRRGLKKPQWFQDVADTACQREILYLTGLQYIHRAQHTWSPQYPRGPCWHIPLPYESS